MSQRLGGPPGFPNLNTSKLTSRLESVSVNVLGGASKKDCLVLQLMLRTRLPREQLIHHVPMQKRSFLHCIRLFEAVLVDSFFPNVCMHVFQLRRLLTLGKKPSAFGSGIECNLSFSLRSFLSSSFNAFVSFVS